jgi:hypothetical protein
MLGEEAADVAAVAGVSAGFVTDRSRRYKTPNMTTVDAVITTVNTRMHLCREVTDLFGSVAGCGDAGKPAKLVSPRSI